MRPALVPIRLGWDEGGPVRVLWADLGVEPFRDPFFGQTIERRWSSLPEPRARVTGIEGLTATVTADPGLAPSGFIFHTSRCGSTLVAQMLAALDRVIVLAEPVVLHQALSAPEAVLPGPRRRRLLRDAVHALGCRRSGTETALVIKFTSSDVLFLPEIRAAFPEVPWIFLYRDPLEVLVSVLSQPTGWLRLKQRGKPLALPGRSEEELRAMPEEAYSVEVLASFCRCAMGELGPGAMVLDYRRLPDAVVGPVAEHFELELTADDRRRMLEVSRSHSKDPRGGKVFVPDAARKRATASATLRRLVEEELSDLFSELARVD